MRRRPSASIVRRPPSSRISVPPSVPANVPPWRSAGNSRASSASARSSRGALGALSDPLDFADEDAQDDLVGKAGEVLSPARQSSRCALGGEPGLRRACQLGERGFGTGKTAGETQNGVAAEPFLGEPCREPAHAGAGIARILVRRIAEEGLAGGFAESHEIGLAPAEERPRMAEPAAVV